MACLSTKGSAKYFFVELKTRILKLEWYTGISNAGDSDTVEQLCI